MTDMWLHDHTTSDHVTIAKVHHDYVTSFYRLQGKHSKPHPCYTYIHHTWGHKYQSQLYKYGE